MFRFSAEPSRAASRLEEAVSFCAENAIVMSAGAMSAPAFSMMMCSMRMMRRKTK